MKRWNPGRKAIAQMFAYADKFLASESTRVQRRGLFCKAQALIYTDRMAGV
jgi:hypothetical protein